MFKVINIQRHEVELNVILPRINQKKAWNIFFDYMQTIANKIWEDKG